MMSARDELLQKLEENYLFYKDEIGLLTDGLPDFIRSTLKVHKLADHCYCINYLFFGRPICYALTFDGNTAPILDYLQTQPSFAEVHTNVFLGEANLSGKRNLYGNIASAIAPIQCKIGKIQIIRFTAKELQLFESLKEELNQSGFDSFDFLRDGIANGQLAVFGAISEGKCLSYARLNLLDGTANSNSIVEPTVYTVANHRCRGIAATLLTTIFTEYYADHNIAYGVDMQNIPSNRLAQSIGLSYLGTKYRYTNN